MQNFESNHITQVEFFNHFSSIIGEIGEKIEFESLQDCGRLLLIHQLLDQKGSNRRSMNAIRLAHQMLVRSHREKVQVSPPRSASVAQFIEKMILRSLELSDWQSANRLKLAAEELLHEKLQKGSISISSFRQFCQVWVWFVQEYLESRLSQIMQTKPLPPESRKSQASVICYC